MSQAQKLAGAIFDGAIELLPDQRAGFLEQKCAGNALLRQRVEALLRAHESAGPFMERPALGPLPEMAELTIGEQSVRIGRYKLLQQIGEGGCGVVFMAEQQEPVRRRVALKVIKLGMDTKRVVARFEAERQALALMDHPNIAKVMDAGATETGRPYFVMELVKGIPITRFCDQQSLNTEQRLRLFIQVCRAIQHAHQKGIIHRDIKPSNILVTEHDGIPVPKIIDFGIAKATGDQRLTDKTLFTAFEQFVGTPAYMSPEQARLNGLDIDTRSDIYSLGVLLYELLTGQTPFETQRLVEAGIEGIGRIIREEEPVRPSTRLSTMMAGDLTVAARQRHTEPPKLIQAVCGDLDWIVMKAMEKERARRYETANGLGMDVERHLQHEPIVARPASNYYRLQKFGQRHKLVFAGIGAVAVVLVLGIIATTHEALLARRAEQQQSRLRAEAEKERQKAETGAAEATQALASSDLVEANRLIAGDDGPDAVAYLSRILTAEPGNGAALTRLATLLTYNSWMVPTLSLQHGDVVSFAQFSPDGRRVVTASWDNTARVWDAQTGQPLTGPLKHGDLVSSAQFDKDSRRVVTASWDNTARVWDAQTGEPLTRPLKHGDLVFSAQFSPDGQRIVTASKDNNARVWDSQTGELLINPLKHSGPVNFAQFSPNGKLVVTASFDHTARVWDAQTGQPMGKALNHAREVTSAQFSPDGQRIVTASWDNTARVWDAHTGQPLTAPLAHKRALTSAQFSPDGQRIVTASQDNTARVWDAQTGQPLTEPLNHGSSVTCAQFNSEGGQIVTASRDGTTRVWDARTGQLLTEPLKHGASVFSAQFSPDGHRIVTASQDNSACVWDAQTGPPLPLSLTHGNEVLSVQFSPDGRRVVTGSTDGTARLWDAQTGRQLINPLQHGGPVRRVQFSPDGLRLATASDDHTARVWDTQTGRPLIQPLRHEDAVYSAQFSPDGQRLVTASRDGTVRVWDAQIGRPLAQPMHHGAGVNSARFSPDGQHIVSASWDNTARVWDAQTGKLLGPPLPHRSDVFCAEFSPDGQRILTASQDNTARVWDAQTGQPLTRSLKHLSSVYVAQFSPDGRHIVTASQDNTARVWDAQTGQPLTQPLRHEGMVYSAQFSPDGQRIVTACEEGAAQMWDAQTGEPLTEPLKHKNRVNPNVITVMERASVIVSSWNHGNGVDSVQFSPDGQRIVIAFEDNAARIWDVGLAPSKCPGWLLPLAEALSGIRLDKQGVLQPTSLDRARIIAQMRRNLEDQPDIGDGVRWGRWLLANRSSRTISPYCTITIPQYIENRISEGTAESLDEAQRLALGKVELSQRILDRRALFERTNRPSALEAEAKALADQAKLAEAEAKFREALTANRELWTNQPVKWVACVKGLINVLWQEAKFEDAEKVFQEILTPGFVAQPQSAALLGDRTQFFARRGRWKEAAEDLSRLVQWDPGNHWLHHLLAPLLAQSGDLDGYRRHCERVLALFGGTNDPVIAERMAKACLILPDAGVDLGAAGRLADTAVRQGQGHSFFAFFAFAKGLAEYRQGHFASAADWTQKALAHLGEEHNLDAQAYLVLAMARWGSKQYDAAHTALVKGSQIVETGLPKLDSGDLGQSWDDWIITHALLAEAKALIEPPAAPGN